MISVSVRRVVGLVSAFVIAASFSVAAQAQDKMATDKMAPKADKMAGAKMDKMAMPVYACPKCKMAYSAADAKKMGMKDPMGHKMMKMDKMPAGYKMGGKMDKMDKMGGKMDTGKMDKMAPKP
jgi:hypothetical protein